jgi:hypothetical protein
VLVFQNPKQVLPLQEFKHNVYVVLVYKGLVHLHNKFQLPRLLRAEERYLMLEHLEDAFLIFYVLNSFGVVTTELSNALQRSQLSNLPGNRLSTV